MKKSILLVVLLVILSLVPVSVYAQSTTTSLPNVVVSLLNQNPSPAKAGDSVTLRFKFENYGGIAVDNLAVELIPDFPFIVSGSNIGKTISHLSAYQSGNDYVPLEFNVQINKDAIQGQKTLKLKYKYDNNDWITTEFNIDISSQQFAQIIYVDKSKLEPGKETEMNFTIINLGNAPLQNMIFSWNEAKGTILPVYSSDTKYVKYLGAGESVVLSYKVIADINANPGLYQLDLTLKSESTLDATQTTTTTKAGVFVGGETNFDVAFSESSAGQTSLSVSNIGSNPAQSVSVTIPSQSAYRISGTNSAIIGNLDKGDYTLVSFQIAAANSATNATFGNTLSGQTNAGPRAAANSNLTPEQMASFRSRLNNTDSNGLKVIIDYTDTTGQRRSFNKTVQIQFRSATSLTNGVGGYGAAQTTSTSFIGSTTFYYILAGVVLLVGFYIYRKTMKNKK